MAFDLVSTVNVTTTGVTQINFSSIPQTGKDLFIIISARNVETTDWDQVQLYINGVDTNQSSRLLTVNGTAAAAIHNSTGSISGIRINAGGSSTSCFSGTHVTILDYSSTANKGLLIEAVTPSGNSIADTSLAIGNGLWNGGAAVTDLSFRSPSNAYVVGTSISLYILS